MKPPGGPELKRNVSPLAFSHCPFTDCDETLARRPFRGAQEKAEVT